MRHSPRCTRGRLIRSRSHGGRSVPMVCTSFGVSSWEVRWWSRVEVAICAGGGLSKGEKALDFSLLHLSSSDWYRHPMADTITTTTALSERRRLIPRAAGHYGALQKQTLTSQKVLSAASRTRGRKSRLAGTQFGLHYQTTQICWWVTFATPEPRLLAKHGPSDSPRSSRRPSTDFEVRR